MTNIIRLYIVNNVRIVKTIKMSDRSKIVENRSRVEKLKRHYSLFSREDLKAQLVYWQRSLQGWKENLNFIRSHGLEGSKEICESAIETNLLSIQIIQLVLEDIPPFEVLLTPEQKHHTPDNIVLSPKSDFSKKSP